MDWLDRERVNLHSSHLAANHHRDALHLAEMIGYQNGRTEAVLGIARANAGLRDPTAARYANVALAAANRLRYRPLAQRAQAALTEIAAAVCSP
jgi:hypothetical protein